MRYKKSISKPSNVGTTTGLCLRTNSENVETLITKNKCLKIRNVTKFVGTLTFI